MDHLVQHECLKVCFGGVVLVVLMVVVGVMVVVEVMVVVVVVMVSKEVT